MTLNLGLSVHIPFQQCC